MKLKQITKFYLMCALLFINAHAQEKIPSKSELDAVMINAVKQMNAQMAGVRIDENTNFKYVTYDLNPPLFSYVYTSNALSVLKQENFTQAQMEALKKFNTAKTCSSQFKPLMKPYNLKVAHVFEDKNNGKIIYKLNVTYLDC
jgi:hypothetical protein